MKIITIPVGRLSANAYVVVGESKKCLIIDPGGDFLRINDVIRAENATPIAVLLTHGHFDHIGAAGQFAERGVDLFVGEKDLPMLSSAQKNLAALFGIGFEKIDGAKPIGEGLLGIGEFDVEVISTAGHSLGSVCYKIGDNLFSGDTLFRGGYGRYDFEGGDYDSLMRSLKKLKELPNLTVYTGHGEKTTLQREKTYGILRDL